MLQIGSDFISKSLSVIFGNYLRAVKKTNVVPVYKKRNKKFLNYYEPIYLFPIWGKHFQKIVFESIFQHLMENNLLNPNQAGFMSGNFCIHQLISVTHEIYAYFGSNPSLEVRVDFKIYLKLLIEYGMKGFIYKIKCMGVKGDLLTLIESFLLDRQQIFILNEKEYMAVNQS